MSAIVQRRIRSAVALVSEPGTDPRTGAPVVTLRSRLRGEVATMTPEEQARLEALHALAPHEATIEGCFEAEVDRRMALGGRSA